MVMEKRDHPGNYVRQKHLDFISANWEMLAFTGYQEYQQKGRGMLFVDEADFINKPRGVLTRIGVTYVAEGSKEFKAIGGKWPGQKEERWVRSYNVDREILVCFARTDLGVSSYKVQGLDDRIPVMIYKRSMEKNKGGEQDDNSGSQEKSSG